MIRVPQCHSATVHPPLTANRKHLENTKQTMKMYFIYWLSSLQQKRRIQVVIKVPCPASPCLRCQISFKFYLFCSIPVSGWCRLEEFLHEDLKIVGCKIKRYFKMCLPVFIGSIKESFGSAFWPPWSGGHFYNQSSKHDELSELETNFVVAGVGRDLTDDIRYLI